MRGRLTGDCVGLDTVVSSAVLDPSLAGYSEEDESAFFSDRWQTTCLDYVHGWLTASLTTLSGYVLRTLRCRVRQ